MESWGSRAGRSRQFEDCGPEVYRTDAERDGIGEAVGARSWAELWVQVPRFSLGRAVHTLLVPGVGTIFAIGLGAAAVLGLGGAAAGASVGMPPNTRWVQVSLGTMCSSIPSY